MKILLVHQVFALPSDPGGSRHYDLARYCLKQGHEVTVVTSDLIYQSSKRREKTSGLVTETNVDGIKILRAYTYPSLNRSFPWRVFSFMTFMVTSVWAGLRAGPADLVMGTSPPIFQAASAWFIAALRRKPFLLEIRDLWPDFAIDMGVLKSRVLIKLSRWLEHFLYRHADHLLVNSPAYRDYLLSRGVAAGKISFVANGVDPDSFRPETDGSGFRRQWDCEGKFVAVYAGAMGMANDLGTILRAADLLRDQRNIQFLMVGEGKERASLEAQAKSMGLPNVKFTGPVPKSAMGACLAGADVCLATLMDIPMFTTTYPNKVFDYMAAGKPVVLGIDGVIRDVVQAGPAGLCVHPGDSTALAAAVKRLSVEPETCQKMGQTGRKHVVKFFNRHVQSGHFESVLRQCLDQNSA